MKTCSAKYLGIHDVGGNIRICDVLPKFAPQFRLDLLEVKRLHSSTWTSINSRLISNDFCAQWLWETPNRLSKVTLEELNNGRWEVELFSACQNIFFRERVGCHPLRKVPNDL